MKDPFALSVSVPCAGAVATTAVIGSPSRSVSFASTPGAATFSVPACATLYASAKAFGALSGDTLIVTVAAFESLMPLFALYVNASPGNAEPLCT